MIFDGGRESERLQKRKSLPQSATLTAPSSEGAKETLILAYKTKKRPMKIHRPVVWQFIDFVNKLKQEHKPLFPCLIIVDHLFTEDVFRAQMADVPGIVEQRKPGGE